MPRAWLSWPAGTEYPMAPGRLPSRQFQSSPEWATLTGDKARQFHAGPGLEGVQAEDRLGRLPPSRFESWRVCAGPPKQVAWRSVSLRGWVIRPDARPPGLTG